MSSSSSHPTDGDGVYIRQSKGAPFKFLIPLIYAPVLPLIRLTLRHKPVLRDRLFTGVLVGALLMELTWYQIFMTAKANESAIRFWTNFDEF